MITRAASERARTRVLVRNALAGREQVRDWCRLGLGRTPEEVKAGATLRSRIAVAVRRGDRGAAQRARNEYRRYKAALAARDAALGVAGCSGGVLQTPASGSNPDGSTKPPNTPQEA